MKKKAKAELDRLRKQVIRRYVYLLDWRHRNKDKVAEYNRRYRAKKRVQGTN
jgi:hypothetical protein